ncbi:hypothetical protein GCM10027456_22140 [Kineosporia babensis]
MIGGADGPGRVGAGLDGCAEGEVDVADRSAVVECERWAAGAVTVRSRGWAVAWAPGWPDRWTEVAVEADVGGSRDGSRCAEGEDCVGDCAGVRSGSCRAATRGACFGAWEERCTAEDEWSEVVGRAEPGENVCG